ncbi:uncharacterized protein MONOS_12554 [Monocercomonoides exilis]|uniref:uncharacterized protein n=1 Tax=Monocercomonoides exilis TaxID=2049356 RepID=UPI00355989BD|nr:hypothetical protein MONOS_12554 [Monocercomonoides exilis]|eukprot:MONOS_12554.1-p1 / transcript=MONOS_12554.1 / gene=MONOS_12554 / organism=Monocercomonoides_exilis_PA203 / gene_product=unspecified product / transcript_product=unspecified product / location=Mono_scaffold00701:18179-19015(+) / protein_length=279 / sequence_SO=supercontig / SO=protein_coding / is_pseudo=false
MGSADHKIRKMTTLLEGPASGLSGIFPQSGPTGGMGMAPPISIPTTDAPGSQFPAMSAMSSTTSTTSTSTSSVGLPHSPTQPLLEAAKLYFGENLQSTIFAYRVDQGDLLQTLRDYESFSVPPFLPATTHPHSRSQSWFSDALDEGAYNVESLLMPALKAMLMATRGTTEEAQQHQEDAMMLSVAALQAARQMRIQARFGFKAAKTLQDEKDDPLLTTEQLERIKPILQARTERRHESSASHLSQRTRRIGSWKSRSTSSGTGRSTRAASRSNFFRRK